MSRERILQEDERKQERRSQLLLYQQQHQLTRDRIERETRDRIERNRRRLERDRQRRQEKRQRQREEHERQQEERDRIERARQEEQQRQREERERQRERQQEERERQRHVANLRNHQVQMLVNELGIEPAFARTALDDHNGNIIRTRYHLLRTRYVENMGLGVVPASLDPIVTSHSAARSPDQVRLLSMFDGDTMTAIAMFLDGRSLFALLLTSRASSTMVLAATRAITETRAMDVAAAGRAQNIADLHHVNGQDYMPYYTPAWVSPRYMRLWLLNQFQLIDKGVQFNQFVNTRPCACIDDTRPSMQTVESIPHSLGPGLATSDIIMDIGLHFVRVRDEFELRRGRRFGIRQWKGHMKAHFAHLLNSHHIEQADFVQEGQSNMLPNLCAVTVGANAQNQYWARKFYRSGIEHQQEARVFRSPGSDCIFSLNIKNVQDTVTREHVKQGTLIMHPFGRPPYELATDLRPPFVWAAVFEDDVAGSYHHMHISKPYNNVQLDGIKEALRSGSELEKLVFNYRTDDPRLQCGYGFLTDDFVSRVVWA